MLRNLIAAPLLMVAMLLTASAPTVASAEGGTSSAADATTVCATPGTNTALVSLCGLLAGNTLPEEARAEVASMIMKLWKASQEPAKVTTPEAACALAPAPHAALPVLCTLWTTGNLLPPEIKEVMGRLVVHLANGKFEAARLSASKPDAAAKTDAAPKAFKAPSNEKQKEKPKVQDTSLLAKCKALLAEHPEEQGEKAQYCRKVVAGETLAPSVAPKPKEPTTSIAPRP